MKVYWLDKLKKFRVQGLACVVGKRQPKGWTLNFLSVNVGVKEKP
jgi:hypothetical protein